MTNVALKEKAINYITAFDEKELELAVSYMETLPRRKNFGNSKSPEERLCARQAFDEIIAMSFTGSSDISKDGAKEEMRAFLDSFRGSSHCWDGLDPVDYQRKIREEREIVQPHIS